jgi:hypothetical protein
LEAAGVAVAAAEVFLRKVVMVLFLLEAEAAAAAAAFADAELLPSVMGASDTRGCTAKFEARAKQKRYL